MAALSNQELTDALDDIVRVLNDVQTAITKLASKKQLEQLNFINQSKIDDLLSRMTEVEAQIVVIQNLI